MTEMTPQDRCYQILKEADVYRTMKMDHMAESITEFIESGEGCNWLNPTNKIEERQFETIFKNYFDCFNQEQIDFAKSNPPTIDGKQPPFKQIGLHTLDDQGFEGQILKDGSYYRWIQDLYGKFGNE